MNINALSAMISYKNVKILPALFEYQRFTKYILSEILNKGAGLDIDLFLAIQLTICYCFVCFMYGMFYEGDAGLMVD